MEAYPSGEGEAQTDELADLVEHRAVGIGWEGNLDIPGLLCDHQQITVHLESRLVPPVTCRT